MSNKFKPLEKRDDVLSFGDMTYKVDRFMDGLNDSYNDSLGRTLHDQLYYQGIKIDQEVYEVAETDSYELWFTEGICCEVLRLGASRWQKGKIKLKITLEFCPDEQEVEELPPSNGMVEPESPLDDLRQMVN